MPRTLAEFDVGPEKLPLMTNPPFFPGDRRTKLEPILARRSLTFVPRNYEPRYAYPLLVLFHGRCGDENQLIRLMPRLSTRNYIAMGLRGPETTRARRDGTVGYAWAQTARGASMGEGVATLTRPRLPQLSEASPDFLFEYVTEAVEEAREHLNICPERIFLVGYGEGAAAAYRLGLAIPDQFAGIVALNGWLPRCQGPLIWLPQARGQRVLILHGRDNRLVPASAAKQAHLQLLTAGLDSTLHMLDAGHRIHSKALRLMDSWIMEHCVARPAHQLASHR